MEVVVYGAYKPAVARNVRSERSEGERREAGGQEMKRDVDQQDERKVYANKN